MAVLKFRIVCFVKFWFAMFSVSFISLESHCWRTFLPMKLMHMTRSIRCICILLSALDSKLENPLWTQSSKTIWKMFVSDKKILLQFELFLKRKLLPFLLLNNCEISISCDLSFYSHLQRTFFVLEWMESHKFVFRRNYFSFVVVIYIRWRDISK